MSKTLQEQAIDMVISLSEIPVPAELWHKWDEVKLLAAKLKQKPPKPTVEEIEEFNLFRIRYRRLAAVKGCMEEMKCLVKHKDWRDALPTMQDNLDRQCKEREAMADSGQNPPPWPHLSTYLNQRRWEMVYFDIEKRIKTNLPEKYVDWLRRFESKYLPFQAVVERALTLEQCTHWIEKSDEFKGLDRSLSVEAQKSLFDLMHSEYYGSQTHRLKYKNVGDFFVNSIKPAL